MRDKITKIEELLALQTGELSSETELINVRKWDSFAIMNFIAAFSTLTNPINLSDLRNCETVEDLCKLIEV